MAEKKPEKKGFDFEDLVRSPIGSMGFKVGMGLLSDVYSSRTRKKQLRQAQQESEQDLRDAYIAMGEDMQTSYGTSGLAPTYGFSLREAYEKGLQRTREAYAKANKSSKSWLGSIFFD